LDGMLAMGSSLFRPLFLCFLAEACLTTRRFEEGLAAAEEAIAIMRETKESCYEAELHRLKGGLILGHAGAEVQPRIQAQAEECFRKSIEVARQQEAKSFELRAVTSLSRLWKQQGKKAEARQALAEIYGWFSEGFDTADLKEAKALLEELSA